MLKKTFYIAGWILLILFLGSGYLFNRFSEGDNSMFSPISWEDHLSVFDGALTCSLTTEEELNRRLEIKELLFSNLKKKEELENGYLYYFESKEGLYDQIAELIGKEMKCCPFFKFDLSILPFGKGMALKISGGEGVKEFLKDFENSAK